MKKKSIFLFLTLFLAFTINFLVNSNVSIYSNYTTMNPSSEISTRGGKTLWPANGSQICAFSFNQESPALCSDGAGGAIIAWTDFRNGAINPDIYAQRIYTNGSVAWATTGVAVCSESNYQTAVKICSDGAGGAIISWGDFRNGFPTNPDIFAQKINANGVKQWTPTDGVDICTWSGLQGIQEMCSDGAGGAIITWQDERTGMEVYAQRVLTGGTTLWGFGGLPMTTLPSGWPEICSDGVGGAIIAFPTGDLHAQKVNSIGTVQWTATGIPVCLASNQQQDQQIISDGSGGAIVVWEDYRSGSYYHIYASKINAAGVFPWESNGVPICTLSANQDAPQICSDGAGGAIITWTTGNIAAQRISSAGNVLWTTNGVDICTAGGAQNEPQICNVSGGGAIITWYDERAGPLNADIYAQKVSTDGAVEWNANGVLICNADGIQGAPQICSDGAGGAIITWDDERMGSSNINIYAQRIIGTPDDVLDIVALISLAALAQYGGLIEDISKILESALSILLSPIVLGSIVLGEALIIVITCSIIAHLRKTPGKSKKAKK